MPFFVSFFFSSKKRFPKHHVLIFPHQYWKKSKFKVHQKGAFIIEEEECVCEKKKTPSYIKICSSEKREERRETRKSISIDIIC